MAFSLTSYQFTCVYMKLLCVDNSNMLVATSLQKHDQFFFLDNIYQSQCSPVLPQKWVFIAPHQYNAPRSILLLLVNIWKLMWYTNKTLLLCLWPRIEPKPSEREASPQAWAERALDDSRSWRHLSDSGLLPQKRG